jgi:hypothetical protein
MSLFKPSTWTRRGFFRFLDWVSTVAGIGCTVWIASSDGGMKWWASACAARSALLIFVGKRGVEVVDEREKSQRASARQTVARELLRYMHDDFFDKGGVADEFHHRITLFVCEVGDAPDGSKKRLRVFARRGGDENSQTAWPVDDSDPTKCRGLAGLIWYNDTAEFFDAGWDWDDNGTEAQKAGYAKALRMTTTEAAALTVKSRYFAGAVVMVGGTRWGVLLIDSLTDWREKSAPGKERQQDQIWRYALLVSTVLGHVKP